VRAPIPTQGAVMRKMIVVALILFAHEGYAAPCSPLLNRTIITLQGESVNLCEYADKPILVVNTASKCGFTEQFEKLEVMYEEHKKQGLLVIGFPSNDFNQELSSNHEIAKFCKLTYNVKFPMSKASNVTGNNTNSFYLELAKITDEKPRWNFHKYLIARDGKTVYSFASSIKPDSVEVMSKLLPMLK